MSLVIIGLKSDVLYLHCKILGPEEKTFSTVRKEQILLKDLQNQINSLSFKQNS